MPKPLSIDLRERIVAAYENGEGGVDDVANTFKVGRATVVRLLARKRRTGSVAPTQQKHGPDPSIDEQGEEILLSIVAAKPDITLDEVVDEFREATGQKSSPSTIGRVFMHLGLTRKKRPSSLRNETTRGSSGFAIASYRGARPSTRRGSSS